MIRALLCVAPLALSACAGTASYTVHPFFEPNLNKMVCCEAEATNSKNIAALSFDLSTSTDGVVTVHFNETGVNASKPLTAQGAVVSNVATAVSNAAAAAIKITP